MKIEDKINELLTERADPAAKVASFALGAAKNEVYKFGQMADSIIGSLTKVHSTGGIDSGEFMSIREKLKKIKALAADAVSEFPK
jgi:hypothetical protein